MKRRKHKLRIYGPRPEWVPRAVWLHGRRWRRMAWLNGAVIVALVVGLILSPELPLNGPCFGMFCVFIAWIINGMLIRRYKRWWVSSFYRRLRRLDFQICLDCGYDLHGLPEAHVCPECSRPYELNELTEAWRGWVVDALDLRLFDPGVGRGE